MMGFRLTGQISASAGRSRIAVRRFVTLCPLLQLLLWLSSGLTFVSDREATADELDFPPLGQQPFLNRRERPDESAPSTGTMQRPSPRDGQRSADPLDFPPLDEIPTRDGDFAPPDDQAAVPGSMEEGPDWVELALDTGFDWTTQTVTPADLGVGTLWPFLHGRPGMAENERLAYGELIRLALARRALIPAGISESANADSIWEATFYRYRHVRRLAWQDGNLQLGITVPKLADPFAAADQVTMTPLDTRLQVGTEKYSLLEDMRVHPADFVGRPVRLYGVFSPTGLIQAPVTSPLEGEPAEYQLQRGSLKALAGGEAIAVVDAINFIEPGMLEPSTAWPIEDRVEIPVLVKGWYVKQWGGTPLIFAETLQTISPRPYREVISRSVTNRRRVGGDESWLYYETLRQLQLTRQEAQEEVAERERELRLQMLRKEVRVKAAEDQSRLTAELNKVRAAEGDRARTEELEQQVVRVRRQLSLRESRFQTWINDPQQFPLFVDVFRNPDYWQGRLLTVNGYVRRVLEYAGEAAFFDGQPLYELWLYTDDGQHIPTVVVTPDLPADFPTGAELVNSVQVTGCLFKMYVYRSQRETRLAPLLLAGRIQWSPDPQHVNELVRGGYISADAAIATRARAAEDERVSDTIVLLFSGLLVLGAVTVWGRVQRDRRERKRLLQLVDELPDFAQTPDSSV